MLSASSSAGPGEGPPQTKTERERERHYIFTNTHNPYMGPGPGAWAAAPSIHPIFPSHLSSGPEPRARSQAHVRILCVFVHIEYVYT